MKKGGGGGGGAGAIGCAIIDRVECACVRACHVKRGGELSRYLAFSGWKHAPICFTILRRGAGN